MNKKLAASLAAALLASGMSAAHAATVVSQNLGAGAYSASSTWYDAYSPATAFDGNIGTNWNSASPWSGWIEVNLGHAIDISQILLNVNQAPSPASTVHQVWLSNSSIQYDTSGATLAHTFAGETYHGQLLTLDFSTSIAAQYVQIRTTWSPSWVSWNEIQVLAADGNPVPEPSTAWLLGLGVAAMGGIRHKKARR